MNTAAAVKRPRGRPNFVAIKNKGKYRQCKTCEYWMASSDGMGTCHANPPTGYDNVSETTIPNLVFRKYPTTMEIDWCGKYKRYD